MPKIAIVGGGAAGFFLAINLKEMAPQAEVCILERSRRVLAKVEVSGGGRCNCTNTFRDVSDLQAVYPRGHRLLKRLFKVFGPRQAYEWMERRGVRLTVQADQCVFPASQDSHTIINLFLAEARRLGISIETGRRVSTLKELAGYDFVAVTTGGSPRAEGLQWLADRGHEVAQPVPSLFTLSIDDAGLRALMGTVADEATVYLPGTPYRAGGPLLITHWGVSGPAVLRLSSYAARHLAQAAYRVPLAVNWASRTDADVLRQLTDTATQHPHRQLGSVRPLGLPARLWDHLLNRCLGQRATIRWEHLTRKELNRLVNTLCNDTYTTVGRAAFRDEFVTCGGIALTSVNPATLESRHVPHLYFAGEVLDIDGVTGGFNFQAAWTTAFVAAQAISQEMQKS